MAKIEILSATSKKGDYPHSPFVHIWLAQYTKNEEGKVLLSPQLMTDKEVDETIDQLISQLEVARKAAKKALKK